MAAHDNDDFLKKLEDAMRAEFFPGPEAQARGGIESLERQTMDRLASRFPNLFGGPTPGDMDLNSLLAQISELTGQLGNRNSSGLASASLQSMTQRLQELPLDDETRDQVDSIAHSARDIRTSSNYINRTMSSMVPMLKSMTELLFSPELDSLADPSLSDSERASRAVAFIDNVRNVPGFSEGVEEISQNVPGIRSLVNNQLDSFMSRIGDFQAAAERPMLPDLSTVPEFRYESLATQTSIRVLRLEATHDTAADANSNLGIKLRVEEVNLDDNPEFNALSYVWGDHRAPLGQDYSSNRARRAFDILCNGHRISVTYNLFCFLRRLSTATQGALDEIRGMPLWIDQLCINQSDSAERAVQVSMMDRVYSQAGRVVSWLGESDSQVDGAIGVLGRLKDVPLGRVSQPDFDVARFVKDIANDDWLALGALLSRPYFKRAWIVQEIAMAKQLLVVCGKHTLRWDDLVHCSAVLEKSTAWTMLSRYISVFRSVQDHVSPEARRPQSLHYGGQLAALLEAQNTVRDPSVAPENLLLLGKQFDATVPLDKYFAMLGLHRRRLGGAAAAGDALRVDYSKSLKNIALEFAKSHIQASGSLRILSLVEDAVHRSPASAEFSSWLPDPTAPLRPLPFDTSLWMTAQAHPPRKPPTVEGDTLLVQGKKLTTIALAATPFSTLQQTHDWHHFFDFLTTSPQQPPTTIPPLPLATIVCHTLTTTTLPPSPNPKSPTPPKLPEHTTTTTSPTTAPNNNPPHSLNLTPPLEDFPTWCISLAAAARNPNPTELADAITASTLQQAYRLDDTQFDALAFGKDASSIFMEQFGQHGQGQKVGGGGGSSSSTAAAEGGTGMGEGSVAVDDALRGGEIQFAYMERREGAAAAGGGGGGVGVGRKVEEALRRVWGFCRKEQEEEGLGNGFPSPGVVREGLEVLDRFAEERGEERSAMQHRVDRFAAAVGMRLDSRRLFWTGDGRLGMGPESLAEGDEVWEIDGLVVPAVVRGMDSGAFRFVGEAFVLGLMPGEGPGRTDVSQLVDVVLQ